MLPDTVRILTKYSDYWYTILYLLTGSYQILGYIGHTYWGP